MIRVQKVAVLGAGTMGSRIAAHFANAGIPVRLLDLPADGADRNAVAKKGIETALSHRPPAFFTGAGTRLIEAGNFEDDLPRLADCQWIIEGVVENLGIKRELWSKVALHCHAGAA
jgi:3-hydroxyacyl-CoA dehydrogenase